MKDALRAALAASVLLCAIGAVPTLAQQPSPLAAKCSALRGMAIAADAIGSPTTGADIATAELVPPNGDGVEFCRVNGAIDPVDPEAPDINFQVNLPTDWNGKSIQFGGGGYDGNLITAEGQVSFGADDAATPLQRGYATYGSDSGHQAASIIDGAFMMNDEALANFGGLQIKKTHDVALALVAAYYGRTPDLNYIQGNSQGGHESMIAIQRWPDDYDGAIVTHPANPFVGLQLSGNAAGKALYAEGAWLNPDKVERLNTAVYAACDGLDGAEDGLISDTAACDRAFDVQSLRCPDGDDTGNECLSDAQIAALDAINTYYQSPVELQGGARGFARWPIYEGADLYGLWGMGTAAEPTVPPAPVANFGLAVLADPLIRFAITPDPEFDSLAFDPANWTDRIREVSRIIDAVDPDLSAFAARGGKVLLVHGTIDFAISPHNTTEYYERVVDEMGGDRTKDFLRYYLVPGFGHGSGRFIMRWDPLTVLENWVEHQEAPGHLIATDAAEATAGRTRPLCEYPAFPRLRDGAADLDDAASFACATDRS